MIDRTRREAHKRFAQALQSALSLHEVTQAFLTSRNDLLPADTSGMYWLDGPTGKVLDVWSDADSGFLDRYEAHGREGDPVLDFVVSNRRPADSSRAGTATEWEASGARWALASVGLGHSLEAPLFASGALIGTVNFARSTAADRFTVDDLVSARKLSEQLGLATERAIRYEKTGQRASLAECALNRLSQPVIVSDADGRILFRNRSARDRLTRANPSSSDQEQLEDSIDEALEAFRTKGRRVHTRAMRAPSGEKQIVRTYRAGGRGEGAITLIFAAGDSGHGLSQMPVWDALSRREQHIAQLVAGGLTNRQIAERAFISENTVKQHLKRVFAKTDVKNRAELIQLIWTVARQADASSEPDTVGG